MRIPFSYKDSIEHIEKMLSCLSKYIEISNQQGTNDINVACENLVIMLLNSAYDYKLENYNGKRHLSNAAGIDLIDSSSKKCIQVTSNQTKKKFDETIKACKENPLLKNYQLKFFIISDKANKSMRSRKDHDFGFDGTNDVIDFQSFCARLKSIDHERVIELDRRIMSWLGECYYFIDDFSTAIQAEEKNNGFIHEGVYYARKISAYSNEDHSIFIERAVNPDKYREYTLKDYVIGEANGLDSNYWLLIAAGQAGKTYEAKNLCAQLNKEPDFFPVFFEAKKFNDNPSLDIPYYWQTNHIVFVIDGYDEISSDELRGKFQKQLENLQRKYPNLRIVLTSRRNFISGDNFLPCFKRLYLEDLSFDEVREIAYHSGIDNPDYFLKLIEDNRLYSLAYVPFYLNGLMDYFRKNGSIPRNKLAIYKFLIDSSFVADRNRNIGSVIDLRLRGTRLLQRIALVMQFTEKKELSIDDISDMNFSEEDLFCCLNYSLFHKDDKDCYRFEKNAFQLFYVANYLSGLDVEKIIDLISYRNNGINRIKPEWLDAFELLLSVLPDDRKKEFLLDWTYNNHIEALLNLDPSCLNIDFCHKVFKTILLNYKEKRISSSPDFGWDFDRKLGAFCLNKDSLDFFLAEYVNEPDLGPYLYLLSFIFWFINHNVIRKYGHESAYKDAAYERLKKYGDNECVWYEAAYIPFDNDLFANSADIGKLIEYTKIIKHILLKKAIYRLIVNAKLYDEFVDFSISNEQNIHDFRRKSDSAHVSVSRDNVVLALSQVSCYDSIKKVWQYYPIISKNKHGYRENDAIKILPTLLRNTEILVPHHPDLKDVVDNAWIKESEDHHYFHNSYEPNKIFNLFRNFMSLHSDIDEIRAIVDQLRKIYQSNGTTEECLSLQSKLFIRLKPGNITSLSNEWGDDDFYRTVVFRLRYAPSKDLNDELETLVKTKYSHYLATLPQYPDYEKKRGHDKEIALNRRLFKQYIESVLNKHVVTTRKDLRLKIKEDEELQINDYLWQYLYVYRLGESDGYDIVAVKKSLKSKYHYALFVINTFHNDDSLSEKQLDILKRSVELLLSAKRFRIDYAGYRICTNILASHGFKIAEETILRFIYYAGLDSISSKSKVYSDFISYAIDNCGLDSVKMQIISLLKEKTGKLNHDTLDLLVKYASFYALKEIYGEILRHIKSDKYPINLSDCFYRNNEKEGVLFFMSNFDDLPAEVQLYSISIIYKDSKDRDWIIDAIKRNRNFYDKEQDAKAVKWLVYLGEENALHECLKAVSKDYKALWEVSDVPSFGYKDIRFLPQILELLQLTWNLPESFNLWYSRLKETLLKMASVNIEQFKEVVDALVKMVNSDAKYNSMNYFIGELYCIHEPQVVGARPMSVKEAMLYIG